MKRAWLGEEFLAAQCLYSECDSQDNLIAFGLRKEGRVVHVPVQGPVTSSESPDPELSDEEWLDGWRYRLLEEIRPKSFAQVCSFCGKSNSEVAKLIAGPTCMICNECVELCQEILQAG